MAVKTLKKTKKDNSVLKTIGIHRILNYGSLGTEIKISPKANISVNDQLSVAYHDTCVSITIGIGKDHTAELLMSEDAWKALNAGEEIDITTNKQFKEKFL